MAQGVRQRTWGNFSGLLMGMALGLTMASCNKQPAGSQQTEAPAPSSEKARDVAAAIPSGQTPPDTPTPMQTGTSQPTSTGQSATVNLHQSFKEATREGEEPPPTSLIPPDKTIAGKAVYPIYKAVKEGWDNIRFTTASGKRIDYTALVETDLGTVELSFLPDEAPNHVRNFIALAQAGYYDGLLFERIGHEETVATDGQNIVLDQVQAGCPRGSGELGHGHIGYWLKPETSNKVSHHPGAVGACRAIEADTAACRFYITLNEAPFLDGHFTIFAKVTR